MQEKKLYPFTQFILNEGHGRKVIPFPGVFLHDENRGVQGLILARPGEKLPESIPDFRPQLQRDGLILLSWDKRIIHIKENETLYTAYWVTSSGILRYYASMAMHIEDFAKAMPNRKSYAAEDGIDFYGEAGPEYLVHVAPELMMSCNQKLIQRPEHIKKLKSLGISVDFDYSFSLNTERKKKASNPGSKRGARVRNSQLISRFSS